ncbi:hypothetical protein [Actinomadura macra]|uniref:hypothetical protein n=1 Tax=Actinomadura macra TaxID=46164 RepID=UPI000831D696|nr:hypothetical protein [Actinomadura macra]
MEELPLPDPDLVRAARRHLTSRYASRVEAVLWEMHKHPMHDLDAVSRVLRSHQEPSDIWSESDDDGASDGVLAEGRTPPGSATAMDVGAAFMVLLAARQDVDQLEAALFEQGLGLGLGYEQIAAVLDLPDAEAARIRREALADRVRASETDHVNPLDERSAQRGARDQAARQRAGEAARRAGVIGRRRRLLRPQVPELMPDCDGPAWDGELFWQDPEEESTESAGLSMASLGITGDEDAAVLAALRAVQAERFNAAAREAVSRAHREAAERHEAAARAHQGDVTEHRRLADHHRRATRDDCDDVPTE